VVRLLHIDYDLDDRALQVADDVYVGDRHELATRPVAPANAGHEADDRLAYSVTEAAQRLGVGPMTLYREIAEGKLPAIRIRDRVLVPKVVLDWLVEKRSRARFGLEVPRRGGADVA
jgi:excisionase family DNA binding protein